MTKQNLQIREIAIFDQTNVFGYTWNFTNFLLNHHDIVIPVHISN